MMNGFYLYSISVVFDMVLVLIVVLFFLIKVN